MTVTVLAITIALAGSFYLLVNNAGQLSEGLEATNQMSVFLKPSLADKTGRQLADKLADKPGVSWVKYISKTQSLEEFKTHSGFGEALNALEGNPLPAVIQLLPDNALSESGEQTLKALTDEINAYPEVDFVQMDMQWVRRLQSILEFAGRAVTILNALLAVAVIFISGNTIRLELQNRREEVLVAKLVGATHAFVQRPFVYTGFWLGLAAGVVALLIIGSMVLVLRPPLESISILYHSRFELMYLNFREALLLLGLSACAGAFGAWVVLCQQLRQIKPQ